MQAIQRVSLRPWRGELMIRTPDHNLCRGQRVNATVFRWESCDGHMAHFYPKQPFGKSANSSFVQ